jgi:5-methylthioribose kinase
MNRATFAAAHPEVFLIDPADGAAVSRYLIDLGILSSADRSIHVSRAGDGNMNCTLRVVTSERQLIVKQGRPWVEKYDHLAAPWDRTLVEAAFYEAVARDGRLTARMPRFHYVDRTSRILVLEDLRAPDFTPLYAGEIIDWTTANTLSDYLGNLHSLDVDPGHRAVFANREMRALNHEHMFRFPLQLSNGLDLDRITPGLEAAASALKHDGAFAMRVAELGAIYLADGSQLVHGDFFPGSWLRAPHGPMIIDPEFCFLGHGEFDFGVMIAHLILAAQPPALVTRVREAIPAAYDHALTLQFAGVEIMRRLIGVAQLPLDASLHQKQAWLDRARELVRSC